MIYTEKIKKAAVIAYKAHEGKFDKGGYPYIMHPIHLAEQMDTEDEIITALLHDVIEDSNITIEELETEFSENIVNAVNLLTKNDCNYFEYINNIKKHGGIALKVKIADIKHNMNRQRIIEMTDKDVERLKKYKNSLDLLNGDLY